MAETSNDIIQEIDAISAILMFQKNIGWNEAKQHVYDVIGEWIFKELDIKIE